jgi:hypothetical protein
MVGSLMSIWVLSAGMFQLYTYGFADQAACEAAKPARIERFARDDKVVSKIECNEVNRRLM